MHHNEMYEKFFGFTERPFTLVPDPSFLFWSEQHARAFAIFEFGIISRAPITLLTGEIGAGKTTLLQALLVKLESSLTVGLISNAQGGRGELLQWVLHAFDIEVQPGEDYVSLFSKFQNFLLEEYAEGRRVVLILDEAQNLSIEGLEEIRMLTNINANRDELIQLILVGQPELRDIVRGPRMNQFAQRVAASFHLSAMKPETVRDYIRHRLQRAGGTGEEFSEDAAQKIFEATGGVPRLVNQLCEFALLYAWSTETQRVNASTIDNVLGDGVFFGAMSSQETKV